jgi:hypothetical protein
MEIDKLAKIGDVGLLLALIITVFSFAYLFVIDYVLADVVQVNPDNFIIIGLAMFLLTSFYFGMICFLQEIVSKIKTSKKERGKAK